MSYEVSRLPFHEPRQRASFPEIRNTLSLGQIDGQSEIIDRSIFAKLLVVGSQTWNHNLTWTATDYNTASWSSGSIQLSDGTSYSIDAGNTGNISAKTYIYFDQSNTLKTTTTYTDAISDERIMIAIVEAATDTSAKCIINALNSPGTTIDGDKIVTGKIVSNDGNTWLDLDGGEFMVNDGSNDRLHAGKAVGRY